MEILTAYGIPPKIVTAINMLYMHTTAQVISPDSDTEFLKNTSRSTTRRHVSAISLYYRTRLCHEASNQRSNKTWDLPSIELEAGDTLQK